MTQFIQNFKKLIRFLVSIIASREFAFIYCILGVIAQVAHTYFLTENISSLDGWWRDMQAIIISVFISTSLLYFVAIADPEAENKKEQKRIFWAVNIFMIIEILINFYYYSRHLILDSAEVQIFDFFFAVLVSCLIPVTIKLYAGLIKAKEWFVEEDINPKIQQTDNSEGLVKNFLIEWADLIEDSKFNDKISTMIDDKLTPEFINQIENIIRQNLNTGIDGNISQTDEIITEKIEEIKTDILANLDDDVAKIFNKNQDLFVGQFRNKCKIIFQEFQDSLKTETIETIPSYEIKELRDENPINQ